MYLIIYLYKNTDRGRPVRYILLPLFILFFFQNIYGQTDWKRKVTPAVLQAVSDEGAANFIALMAEQADVGEARFLPLKKDKGAYVFQKLSETAERTQARVVDVLRQFKAPYQSFWIINAVQAKGGEDILQALAALPEVKAILTNPSVKFQEPEIVHNLTPEAVTWGISKIQADAAWAEGFTGVGVVIGGQDTGYEWEHPALKSSYRGWDGNTADHNYNWHDAIHGIDPHNNGNNPCGLNSPEPCDDHYHGTHTMGTMAGSNEIGVAPGAEWIACRNMERGYGMFSSYMECFQWFLAPTDLNNENPGPDLAPHVINNSWYCPEEEGCNTGNYAIMEGVVNNLVSAGVVVVVSAGNSGSGCGTINEAPAMFPGSFSVGATSSDDQIAAFSSRGPTTYNSVTYIQPNVSAPGVGVNSSIPNGSYAFLNGTSMAGPHVAGAVALMISANPDLAGQVSQIEDILQMTATGKTSAQDCGGTPGSEIPNNTFGYGIVNALEAAHAAESILPLELLSFTGNMEAGGIRLNWEVGLPGTMNHFEIERASETKPLNWNSIGRLPFLPATSDYSLLDTAPAQGGNYYRLKMADIDGSISYSHIVFLKMASENELVIYPNPATSGVLNVAGFGEGESFEIKIFDSLGRCAKLAKIESGISVFQLDIQTLPAGAYFLKMESASGRLYPQQGRFFIK